MNPDEIRLLHALGLVMHNETAKSFTVIDLNAFTAPATFTAAEVALARAKSWTPAMTAKVTTSFAAPATSLDTDTLFRVTGRQRT